MQPARPTVVPPQCAHLRDGLTFIGGLFDPVCQCDAQCRVPGRSSATAAGQEVWRGHHHLPGGLHAGITQPGLLLHPRNRQQDLRLVRRGDLGLRNFRRQRMLNE